MNDSSLIFINRFVVILSMRFAVCFRERKTFISILIVRLLCSIFNIVARKLCALSMQAIILLLISGLEVRLINIIQRRHMRWWIELLSFSEKLFLLLFDFFLLSKAIGDTDTHVYDWGQKKSKTIIEKIIIEK